MDNSAPGDLLAELFEEYVEWYLNLADTEGVLPRSISGVFEDGRQFIYLLDHLELHHMARSKYLSYLLVDQGSVAYACGGTVLKGDSDQGEIEEVLEVVAADSRRYFVGQWRVFRDDVGRIAGLRHLGTRAGDDPEKHPSSWFLTGAIRFTEAERVRFGEMLKNDRSELIFSDRKA